MNIFNKILADRGDREECLGSPLRDPMAIARRQNFFATLTGGNGFRTPKKALRTDAQGLTRGQKKRARYKRVFGIA